MTYSFQEAQGASFSVSEISTTVGCTMPDTLQLIDNTLVFGDKSRGIFILQSTDIFDELNVKQLSANIKCEGKPFANGDSFFSCDHDRKYYVFDGKTLYCWDYGRTPYYTSGDHEKAQERLAWFAYEGFEGAVCAFTLEGELYFGFEKNGFSICLFDKNAEFDSVDGKSAPISACLRTKSYDFERYNTPKTAQYICLDYHASAPLASKIEISVFGDGKKFFSAKPRLSKQTARLKLKLPPYCATSFGIEICTASGGVGFSNLSVCVRDSVRKKYTV